MMEKTAKYNHALVSNFFVIRNYNTIFLICADIKILCIDVTFDTFNHITSVFIVKKSALLARDDVSLKVE